MNNVKSKIVILGGGTVNHVRSHLALSAPAYGGTAKKLSQVFTEGLETQGLAQDYEVQTILTKMADSSSQIETNQDVESLVNGLIADKSVKVIVFNIALVDFDGTIEGVVSEKYATRLETSSGETSITLKVSKKLIGKIREERKDIFVIGFKTTADATTEVQYSKALGLLKKNSLNLVVANDTVTRQNFIVAPEETNYGLGLPREEVLGMLVKMTLSRMQNHFTRSTVIPGAAVAWNSDAVPESLRVVVDHCIQAGAYKPFLGKTAGHFAVKIGEHEVLTSIRKSNFNDLNEVGLVKIESSGADSVVAHGFRPSVGGQSQRIVFADHPDKDCIVHFHCPVKSLEATDVPIKSQWPYECGSHECGQNTSRGLKEFDLGGGDKLSVVYLEDHGPNVVFNRKTPPEKVINFIEKNFDLSKKTGGFIPSLPA